MLPSTLICLKLCWVHPCLCWLALDMRLASSRSSGGRTGQRFAPLHAAFILETQTSNSKASPRPNYYLQSRKPSHLTPQTSCQSLKPNRRFAKCVRGPHRVRGFGIPQVVRLGIKDLARWWAKTSSGEWWGVVNVLPKKVQNIPTEGRRIRFEVPDYF